MPHRKGFNLYYDICLSTHARARPQAETKFKVLKFKVRVSPPAIRINNVVLGLEVQDILR